MYMHTCTYTYTCIYLYTEEMCVFVHNACMKLSIRDIYTPGLQCLHAYVYAFTFELPTRFHACPGVCTGLHTSVLPNKESCSITTKVHPTLKKVSEGKEALNVLDIFSRGTLEG